MNQIKEVIDFKEITKGCRNLNVKELMNLLRHNLSIFWSWGSHAYTIDNKNDCRMFRMTVSGNLHKGHVYIFVNGSDLFDVYLTTNRGTIKQIKKDLFFDMLVNWIDTNIEKIPEYSF